MCTHGTRFGENAKCVRGAQNLFQFWCLIHVIGSRATAVVIPYLDIPVCTFWYLGVKVSNVQIQRDCAYRTEPKVLLQRSRPVSEVWSPFRSPNWLTAVPKSIG